MENIKLEYIEYYREVPVQKYASMYVGKSEDTIIRWRHEDLAFADGVKKAKAEWIRKKLIASKAEFALERLESTVFSTKAVNEEPEPTESDKLSAEFRGEFIEWLKSR